MEKDYIEKLIETEQRSKLNAKRLDEVESEVKENRELTIAVKEIATEIKYLREDQIDINTRLKKIEEKPSKNWENLIKTLLTCVATAIAGYFLAKFGL